MKKLLVLVLVLAVASTAFAGTGYYNMAIMDTAQTMKAGKFMITAADDAGMYYSDFSKKWLMGNEATGKLSYYIIEGLEASLQYNHGFVLNALGKVTNSFGNGELDMRYGFGLGDLIKISLGAGVGVPVNKSNGAVTFTNNPVFQFIPEACLSANLGGLNLHFQLKDRLILPDSGDAFGWLQIKGAIAFDFNGFLAAFSGGYDNRNGTGKYLGGPEIIWNVGGPLQINLGIFVDSNFGGDTAYRGVFRASLLL